MPETPAPAFSYIPRRKRLCGYHSGADSGTRLRQPKLHWPPSFALARAYLDQLERSKGLEGGKISAARATLASAEKASGTARQDALTKLAMELDGEASGAGDAVKVRTLAGAVRQLAGATS